MRTAQSLILLSRRANVSQKIVLPRLIVSASYHTSLFPYTRNHCNCRATRSLHSGVDKESSVPSSTTDSPVGFSDVPGVKSAGDKMIIMFTCTVCDTRSARTISKQAYNEGIVMVRCACCNNRHLIADRMGVFEDSIGDGDGPGNGWDIQKYLAKEMGEKSRHITDDNVFELSMEDIVGAKKAAAHRKAVGDGNKDE